ncbi:ABC transporter ATP-binding protein [Candidatus Bathyarchaeota archaeon]|nr:ABC transporter ATP-binding protein [Candidatus Bathyarchaeota archaeon]
MEDAPVLKVENLVKTYKLGAVEVNALRGVNLEVKKGEFVAVMGPSGSGKTTLLNLIGALDKPTKGKVYIDGKDITTMHGRALTKLRRHTIGFVFQFYNLIPVLTAYENIELPLLVAGVSGKDRKKRVKELLDLVGLTSRAKHRPDELSGGEQQRVAIARALANRPKLILADEPTGDLDSKTGREVILALRDLCKREGVSVLVITHDPIVAEMADRVLLIRDGQFIGEKTSLRSN